MDGQIDRWVDDGWVNGKVNEWLDSWIDKANLGNLEFTFKSVIHITMYRSTLLNSYYNYTQRTSSLSHAGTVP